MRYGEFKALIEVGLVDGPFEHIDFYPGPYLPQIPERFVLLTPSYGQGITTEGLFDQEAWQVRTVGEQHDYEDAESLALAVDKILRLSNSQTFQGLRIASINRIGGRPYPLMTDDAERTHFVCNYLLDVQLV